MGADGVQHYGRLAFMLNEFEDDAQVITHTY
jgi:hypothetical protein